MLTAGDAQLSFQEFWGSVCDAMGVEPTEVFPDAAVREDLDFDSLDMAELVLFMDDLGAEVPEGLIPSLETVGDFYDHYRTRSSAEPRS